MSVFIKYVKRVIMASFLIYAFNMVAVNFNVVVPINLWTIVFASIFDVPGISVLLILKTLGV